MISETVLNDKFNMYYAAAKQAHETGNIEFAKRNYELAAETLLKLAQMSSPQLKKARLERARRLIAIASGLRAAEENKKDVVAPGGQSSDDDEGRQWQSSAIPDIGFDDIAGLEDVKRAITVRMIDPLKYPEKYALYGKKSGGGVLLYGPPGTGKTMIAKAIAHEVGAKFYAIKGSDIVSKWVGESEKNINSLFETARKDDLAIIFIDEMDSLIGRRGVDTHNDKRVNEFLQQIDGFVGRAPNLLLLGATNRPWDIDGAAIRSGRFSQKIYVPLPDAPARRFMFKKAIKGVPGAEDIDLSALVIASEGYSGADIEEICDRAKEGPLLKAIETDSTVKVTMRDFFKALSEVRPTVDPVEIARFEKYAGIEKAMPEADVANGAKNDVQRNPSDATAPDNNDKAGVDEPEKKVLDSSVEDDGYKFDWDSLPAITFDDVAGLDEVKETVQVKVLLPLKNPDAFAGYERKNGGGLLLYGPPGTGKTMIAAAIANEIGAKFCSVKPSDLLHQGAGNSEKAVRALFSQARKFPCAVVYFDEMDSITPKDTRSQYAKQLRSELLSQMQGIEAYSGKTNNILFLIAATNKPWDIDSAFVRPGRFGIAVYVGLPDAEARRYMIVKRMDKLRAKGVVQVKEDVDVDGVVAATEGYNGSDIGNYLDKVEEISIMRGLRGGGKYIGNEDFLAAAEQVRSTVQKADIARLMEWKENTTF